MGELDRKSGDDRRRAWCRVRIPPPSLNVRMAEPVDAQV